MGFESCVRRADGLTCDALNISARSTAISVVWNSTTCKQCSGGDGEWPSLQLAVPLMALRVRVFSWDLDSYVARCARYIRIVLHLHGVDGRDAERYERLDLRKNVTQSQNRPT